MANYGIDSIYDPSDVSRMLFELKQQRLDMEEDRSKKIKGATTTGSKLWEMWSREQGAKTQELLDSGYEISPEFTEKNWLSRSFTPASKRVMPIDKVPPSKQYVQPDIIPEGKRFSELTTIESGGISKGYMPPVKKSSLPYWDANKKSFGGGISKEAGSGIGAGLSLYETISSWDEHDPKKRDIKRGVDVGKTLAYTASAVPGPHQAISAPIAVGLSLADLFI